MPRIRSIKPEFCQSETIGKLSRDARLLFIQLWTIVDDEGRSRAASRMLASLLYPYDDDARGFIEGWLEELEDAGCVRRYDFDGATYLEITNWLKHQKIDHPTKSKLPSFDEGSSHSRAASRNLATDLGPRILDQDRDLGKGSSDLRSAAADAAPPNPREELFGRGLTTIARLTGRTPNACRSLVGRWLKLVDDEAIHVLGAIDEAEKNSPLADPTAWITRALQPHAGGKLGKRSVQDAARDLERDLLEQFGDVPAADSRPSRGPPVRLLSSG